MKITTPEPTTSDCFEADIEAERTLNTQEETYGIIPPLYGMYFSGLAGEEEDLVFVFPAMNVNVYMDNNLIGTVELPYQTATESELQSILPYRIREVASQINSDETCIFPEYGVHRVRIEPVENVAGWARGLGYLMALSYYYSESQIMSKLTLIQQPSNRAYYESENNIGEMFKFGQFAGVLIRNQVVIEPVPDDQFSSAFGAYYFQFLMATVTRVTITAQNGPNAPEFWRSMRLMPNSNGVISQLVIQGKIMDANLTGTAGRWETLEWYVGEYGLHIYVDKDLVDDYKALNETIAPYVFSDEVIPDPPVVIASGVYHNPTLGLISVRNNEYGTCITFADKNLGATRVYNNGDTLSQENCGYFYQWGNNYGFPWGDSGSVTAPTSSTQVDTTGYGPENYYNQNLFITGNNDWSSVDNQGLWGDMVQGPCPNGFHIMSITDVDRYHSVIRGISRPSGTNFQDMVKMTGYGAIRTNGTYHTEFIKYRLGTPTTYSGQSWTLQWSNNPSIATSRTYRAWGGYIRPVKDEPVIPDETWIKLY